eukprot:EG_transcript_14713
MMDTWARWQAAERAPDLRPSHYDLALAPAEQAAMQEMHRRHCVGVDPLPKFLQDATFRHTVFRRYLGARSWDIDRASRMLGRTLAWRAENKMDTLPFLPAPDGFSRGYHLDPHSDLYGRELRSDPVTDRFLQQIQKVYHGTWHMWDREGNPVFIERTGYSDPRAMVRIGKEAAKERGTGTSFEEEILHGHLLSMELGLHLTKLQTAKLHRPIFQFTYVLDLKGYKLSHLHQPIFSALKVIIENDKRHYPETTCHAFVVNAPSIVTVAWNIISPLLDQRTREKVRILGSNYHPALEKVIAPAQLPIFLGGECECPGGCVP